MRLSPAAQAVFDEAYDAWMNRPAAHSIAAAALRAAADLATSGTYHNPPATDWGKGWRKGAGDVAEGLRAIANELSPTE